VTECCERSNEPVKLFVNRFKFRPIGINNFSSLNWRRVLYYPVVTPYLAFPLSHQVTNFQKLQRSGVYLNRVKYFILILFFFLILFILIVTPSVSTPCTGSASSNKCSLNV
jgi:hypothetical protein